MLLLGFHVNSFTAQSSLSNTADSNCLGPQITWHLDFLDCEDLSTKLQTEQPHLVLTGNSVEGTYKDYLRRISQTTPTGPTKIIFHEDSTCTELQKHTADMRSVDFDQLLLAFFAHHKSYAFPLPDKEDEISFMTRTMEEKLGSSVLKDEWLRLSSEADKLGCWVNNVRILGIQHMFLETPGRLSFALRKWLDDGDVLPLCADVGLTKHLNMEKSVP